MHNTPPPFFRQGFSAQARLFFFALLSIILLFVDARLHSLELVRKVIGTALYPIQKTILLPRDLVDSVASYFSSIHVLKRENQRLRTQATQHALEILRNTALQAENQHLRQLLKAKEASAVPTLLSEILYDARDPYSHKLIIDRGSQEGVLAGQPVIDDRGVIGQITRVFPNTAELTLITDRDQAIPVQVVRTKSRSVAYGADVGMLELRYMATNADIENNDLLTTSGIDGVYPPGLPVGRVIRIERKAENAFARILCVPIAEVNRNKHVLILLINPLIQLNPVQSTEENPEAKKAKSKRNER